MVPSPKLLTSDALRFFFPSRRRHTRFDCDWSSDVCSSDLAQPDPSRVLRDAGHAMASVKSVKADTRFGPGVTLQGLTLTTASSSVQLPDQSDKIGRASCRERV